jgi:ABC-type branched-subunit amino acid transport system ATPase component
MLTSAVVLDVQNVALTFGGTQALTAVSLQLQAGDIVGLIIWRWVCSTV